MEDSGEILRERKESNQQNSASTVGCCESAALISAQSKLIWRSGIPQDTQTVTIRDGCCKMIKRVVPEKCIGSDGVEDIGHHIGATSQNGWLVVWKKSRDRSGWRELVRCAARAAGRHSRWDRCHGLRVYPVCVCNTVRLPGTGQSAHVIGGSRFTRPASNSRRTLLN